MPLVEMVILGLVLGPILEESFFRGLLLPVLAHTVSKSFAVVLTALLFALFHGPANLAHWASFCRDWGGLRLDSGDVALYHCPGPRARYLQFGSFSLG